MSYSATPKESTPASKPNSLAPGKAAHEPFRLYCRRFFIYLLSFPIILHLIWAYEGAFAFVPQSFLLSLPGIILAALPALLPSRLSRPYLIFTYIFLTLPAFACAMHLALFQTPITAQSFFALFKASSVPAAGLLQEHMAWRLCLLAVVITIIPAWLLHRALKTPHPGFGKTQMGLLVGLGSIILALAVVLGPVKLVRANIIYDVYASLAEFGGYMARLQTSLRQVPNVHFMDTHLTTPSEEERTIVVVVGDFASRAHHNIYGYNRNTTPNLAAFADEIAVFKDIISTCVEPADCMREIISLPGPEGRRLPLFALFNQAGFHTYWLNNQPDIENDNTEAVVLAASAYGDAHLNRGGDPRFSPGLDEKLLAPLEEVLRGDPGRKIIFIRLMGSRPEYAARYSKDLRRFTDCGDVQAEAGFTPEDCASLNDYDNSIIYTDALLKNIIDLTDRLAPESALVYFSSHGANAYGSPYGDSVDSGFKSINYHEIPFFIWLSNGFKAANPDSVTRWPQYTERRATLNDFSHTLADLAGARFDGYDPARSLLSEQFLPRTRTVNGLDYDARFSETVARPVDSGAIP